MKLKLAEDGSISNNALKLFISLNCSSTCKKLKRRLYEYKLFENKIKN